MFEIRNEDRTQRVDPASLKQADFDAIIDAMESTEDNGANVYSSLVVGDEFKKGIIYKYIIMRDKTL